MDVQLFKNFGRAKRNRLLIDWNLKWKGQGGGGRLTNPREVWCGVNMVSDLVMLYHIYLCLCFYHLPRRRSVKSIFLQLLSCAPLPWCWPYAGYLAKRKKECLLFPFFLSFIFSLLFSSAS